MEATKQVDKIFVPKTIVDIKDIKEIKKKVLDEVGKYLVDNLKDCLWVKTDKGYYLPSFDVFIPHIGSWFLDPKAVTTKKFVDYYTYEILPIDLGKVLFSQTSSNYFKSNPFLTASKFVYYNSRGFKTIGVWSASEKWVYSFEIGGNNSATYSNPGNRVIVPCVRMTKNEFLANCFDSTILLEDQQLSDISKCTNGILNNKNATFNNILELTEYFKIDISSEICLPTQEYSELPQNIIAYFLNTDKIRANLNPYDNDILFDAHRGTWDLWSQKRNDDYIEVTTEQKIYARNPIADVQRNSVVGIDFGTKSTVVAFQENSSLTKLMRIGVSNYDSDVKSDDYENPTVLEFCNIESFIKSYSSGISRPRTSWNDLTVSHTAFEKMNDSSDYYSFLYDVKQWSNSSDDTVIKMTDQSQHDFDIKPYLSIEDGDIDPIEIYAYYLGLYINNMRNKIYIKYILSYPVAYPQNVREKLIKSFEKGLKKSLPQAVFENSEIMKSFSVKAGASEPAAYAICALKEYGFNPDPDESVCYGIYDFGGGTTDFDFGQWRRADEDEIDDGYNYVIKHYGDGGVPTLGGENLIELLAYELLKDNKDKLRSDDMYKFTFSRPVMGERFEGDENLVNDSKESRRNLKRVTELLRPLWEGGIDLVVHDRKSDNEKSKPQEIEYSFTVNEGFQFPTSIDLIPRNGGSSESIKLDFDADKLILILVTKIQQGVEEFFRAYELVYKSHSNNDSFNPEIYNIFLAGKSSQSPILKYCFERKIKSYTDKIIGKLKELKRYDYEAENVFFKLYPSLGTAEADKIIGVSNKKNAMHVTGKTGVAYGLVEGRESGDIKIESETKPTDESRFKYYIGKAIRGKFTMITDRDVNYNQWHRFLKASRQSVEIYFSELPSVAVGETDITESGIVKRIITIDDIYENAIIVYRAVAIDTIEYAVSESEDAANNGNYLYGPITEKLSSELMCV